MLSLLYQSLSPSPWVRCVLDRITLISVTMMAGLMLKTQCKQVQDAILFPDTKNPVNRHCRWVLPSCRSWTTPPPRPVGLWEPVIIFIRHHDPRGKLRPSVRGRATQGILHGPQTPHENPNLMSTYTILDYLMDPVSQVYSVG